MLLPLVPWIISLPVRPHWSLHCIGGPTYGGGCLRPQVLGPDSFSQASQSVLPHPMWQGCLGKGQLRRNTSAWPATFDSRDTWAEALRKSKASLVGTDRSVTQGTLWSDTC